MVSKKYKQLEQKMHDLYKTIDYVYCPALDKKVYFNSKGFHHLKYNSHHKPRPIKEQMYKLGLLPLVVPVLKTANTIYSHTELRYLKSCKKICEDWAIQQRVGLQKVLVRVVLRKFGNGKIVFYSVMKIKKRPPK